MSPWKEPRNARWPVYVGIGCVATGMILGLLLMFGVFSGDGDDDDAPPPDPAVTDSTASPATDTKPDGPEVVSWGQQGRQLAVVVRNDSDEVIDQARVRVIGTDADGRQVVSTSGTDNNVCCTIFGLPPGEEFGIYAPIRPSVAKVADVSVVYVSEETRAAQAKEGRIVARAGRLHRSRDNTVVTATLRAKGPVGKYVAVQAFLVRPDGDLAQVISGRYWCYEPGTKRRIRLELYRAVPRDLRLDKVVAHAIPAGVPAGVEGTCRP